MLDNKVALVTGAARGMGAAHVRALVAAGARVVATDVAAPELGGELGDAVRCAAHDVRDPARWDAVVALAEAELGGLDVLVNNAGVYSAATLPDTDFDAYLRIVEVNQHGVFHGMRAVLPALRRRGGGSIINISSISALGGSTSYAYSASKWAVRGMTKSAALALAADGIRVNSVHPGIVDTDMLGDRLTADGHRFAADGRAIPLGRTGVPEDISPIVVYLASDASRWVTGAEHVVDGGQTASAIPLTR